MPDHQSTERVLLDRARQFVADHVTPQVAQRHRESCSSLPWFAPAGQAGLLAVQVPVALGGAGLSFHCKMELSQILAAADFGLSMALVNSHNVAEQVARLGSPALAQEVVPGLISGRTTACTALTESGAGSDVASIQTFAAHVDGGWLLTGGKAWITNAHHADWVVVYAQTQMGAGVAGLAAFLVSSQAKGFERHPGSPQGPISTIGAGAFTLNHCFCPASHLLAPPGEAFKDIMRAINGARIYVAAMCCGMVAECLRQAQAWGRTRHAFGKPLMAHQGWRWSLADADIDLRAAQCLVDEAASHWEQAADSPQFAARAKVFATRMAQRQVAGLMHAMGAHALHDQYPFARHLAAAQVACLVDGSTEMLLERIARDFNVDALDRSTTH